MDDLAVPPRNAIGDRAGPALKTVIASPRIPRRPRRQTLGSPYRIRTHSIRLRVAEPLGTASSPLEAVTILRAIFATLDADREHFVILALDAQNHVLGFKVVATGGATSTNVDAKTLFRDALLLGAVSLILAHNHPSGDPRPSRDDIALTRKLVDGGKLLDIVVRDHIVVGAGSAYVSLQERGLI
jgi:DNA repair protein RadC